MSRSLEGVVNVLAMRVDGGRANASPMKVRVRLVRHAACTGKTVRTFKIHNRGREKSNPKTRMSKPSEGKLVLVRLKIGGAKFLEIRSTISEPRRESTVKEPPAIKTEVTELTTTSNSLSRSPAESSSSRSQHYGTHIGYTTELEPILFDLSQDSRIVSQNASYQKSDDRNAFLIPDGEIHNYLHIDASNLRYIEEVVHGQGSMLMQVFELTFNRTFPVVQDHLLQDPFGSDIDPGLLAAIYALAASSSTSNVQLSPENIDRLEEIAFRVYDSALFKPTLSTIQTGVLLIQRPSVDSKALNTQLVGMAYELGLHLDCTSWSISTEERILRKRLGWALYMQDKWCSLIHGRPSSISRDHWAVPAFDEDDQIEGADEEAQRGRELFIQMTRLTAILSTVLDTFYTLRSMQEVDDAGSSGTRLILERAKPVQIKLKEWFTQLPRNLKMDENMTGKPSSTGHLHLAYFATEITLHRCIIRSLSSNNNDSYLSHVCRSAAKTRLISAMDFVNRLRPEHLTSFWYFPSKVNFALIGTFGSLLLATAPCQEEADFYRTRLSEYRWTLTVSSKSALFLQFAVESLDSSSSLLQHLPQKPSTSELSAQQPQILQLTPRLSPPQDETMADAPSTLLGPFSSFQDGTMGGLMPSEGTASGLISPSTSTSSGEASYEAYAGAFAQSRGMSIGGLWNM